MSAERGRFWGGPIISGAQAKSLIATTGLIYGLIGALEIGSGISRSDFSTVLAGMIFLLPAGAMQKRSRVAAWFLFGISALSLALAAFALVYGPLHREPWMALLGLVIAAFWLPITLVAWRATKAITFLRATGADTPTPPG